MREEFYGWEVFISVRKLLLVTVVMRSPGQELAMTLINLFITVGAFGAQCTNIWQRIVQSSVFCFVSELSLEFQLITVHTVQFVGVYEIVTPNCGRLEATLCKCRCQCD
jgi:hypothetical protein